MDVRKMQLTVCFAVLLLVQVVSSRTLIPWDNDCGVSKGCFPDCPGGCEYLVTWRDTGSDKIAFEATAVNAKSDRWMAVAFSDDYRMGDDSVVTCVFHGNTTSIHTAYTEDTEYEHIKPELFGLSSAVVSRTDDVLSCTFERLVSANADGLFVDLKKKWVLMLAIGETEEEVEADGEIEIEIEHHHDIPKATKKKVNFQLHQIMEERKLDGTLVKLHIIMMIIAWILFSTTGIITARYNKEMLIKRTLFGTKIWFQVHRCCMVMCLICVIVGFVPIFIEVDGYVQLDPRKEYEFTAIHPILGIVVTAIAVMNPIGALLRCGPDHKLRWIFNWAHWAFGSAAHIIAIVTIIFGFYLERANLPRSTVYVAIAYVAVVVLSVFLSEMHKLRTRLCGDENKGATENGVSGHAGTFNMQEETQTRPSMFPMVTFVFTTLAVVIVAVILVVIVIIN